MDPIRPGLLALAAAPALQADWMLVRVALLAFVAATLPHLAFHITTTGSDAASDDALSLGGFGVQLALASWLLARTLTTPTSRSTPWPASNPSPPRRAVP